MKDKKCKHCNITKSINEIVKMKKNKDGYGSTCKSCMKLASDKFRNENPIKQMISCTKSSAKKRGIYFDLKKEDLIIPKFCPYIGVELKFSVGNGLRCCAPTIDRIDNLKGYTKENIMVISHQANRLKSELSINELKNFAKNILEIHK
jgi:hypothetical protein